MPMVVCVKSLTRLGLHYARFPLFPPVSFLLNLDSTRLPGHRYILAYDSLREYFITTFVHFSSHPFSSFLNPGPGRLPASSYK
jgi:hypothetical protein